MMMKPFLSFLFICFFGWVQVFSQDLPFSRGVNLTNWFQVSDIQSLTFGKYDVEDMKNIQSLGCDVIRFPVDFYAMLGPAPDYLPDSSFLFFLDRVIHWSDSIGIHLILDNHTFDPAISTSPTVINWLKPVWKNLAERYAGRYPGLSFEILNEPHGIQNSTWNIIQNEVIKTIRAADPDRWIIAGPADWNSYNSLNQLPVFSDPKIIVTFHFYDPFLLTHQGATWTDPSMLNLAGIPYPYDAGRMPVLPDEFKGTWIESTFNNYSNEGNDSWVKSKLDVPSSFRQTRKQPLFCGEFGVYNLHSTTADRARWYQVVREKLEADSIAWTIWDYQGGFGIFKPDSPEQFDHDLDIPMLEALDFNIPPQTVYEKLPDTLPVVLYSDFIRKGGVNSSWTNDGLIRIHNRGEGAIGMHSIRLSDGEQYSTVGIRFPVSRDFSHLRNENFYLEFRIRGTSGITQVDVRFLDGKKSSSDHPWRNRVILNTQKVNWNNTWQTIRLPLSSFVEAGSWDNNTWHNPQGLFDWTDIERLEFVAEHHDLKGEMLFIDEVVITDGRSTPVETREIPSEPLIVECWPNPFNPSVNIRVRNTIFPVKLQIFTVLGQLVYVTNEYPGEWGDNQFRWNATGFSSGVYLARVTSGDEVRTLRLSLVR